MTIKQEVTTIIDQVRKEGDRAICFYLRKFDGINMKPQDLKINLKKINPQVSPAFRRAVQTAIERVKKFHQLEKSFIHNWQKEYKGIVFGQIYRPVESVAVYVPGGLYPYPSTVVMGVIPAKMAGVKEVVVATPPKNLTPEVIYTARVCGVKTLYRIGGPAAIAALALGTDNIRKVDMIVGPGNAYVTEAKRQLFGTVGIDGLAGPSEVVILVLGKVREKMVDYLIADLLAQAEHSAAARSYLLTDNQQLGYAVRRKLARISKVSKLNCQVIFISRQKVIEKINELAPEHLQIIADNWKQILPEIKNAGAIFVGENTPVALGDYLAGPSHILPTGKSVRFSSGLSVRTFLRSSSIVRVKSVKKENYLAARKLAQAEKMTYHEKSLALRTGEANESDSKSQQKNN